MHREDLFNGLGIYNLEQCRYHDLVELIELPFEIALPQLVKKK